MKHDLQPISERIQQPTKRNTDRDGTFDVMTGEIIINSEDVKSDSCEYENSDNLIFHLN
jgi:hypothetical protein